MTITPRQESQLHKVTRTPALALVSRMGKVVRCIPAGAIRMVSVADLNHSYSGRVTHRLAKTEHLAPRGYDQKDVDRWKALFANLDSDSDSEDFEILLMSPSLKRKRSQDNLNDVSICSCIFQNYALTLTWMLCTIRVGTLPTGRKKLVNPSRMSSERDSKN